MTAYSLRQRMELIRKSLSIRPWQGIGYKKCDADADNSNRVHVSPNSRYSTAKWENKADARSFSAVDSH